MLLLVGRERALAISSMPVREITLSASRINVSGMRLPSLDVHASSPTLNYSFMNSFAICDETVIEFTELLDKLSTAAGMRSIVWRLAREVRKTQRRVNALDKMVIPRSTIDCKIYRFFSGRAGNANRCLQSKMLKKRQIGQQES